MSDLYIQVGDHDCCQHKASRSDVLEWLGWEKCEDCDGLNEVGTNGKKATARNPAHTPCPNCLDGLVPPASQVEAAAFPILDTLAMSWHKLLGISHEEAMQREDFKEMATTLARAALIAAMREGVGDEDWE